MRNVFIPFCKILTNRYHLNLLMIVTLIYHIYIEYELYNLEYHENMGFLYDHQFIHGTMGKWRDHYTFIKVFRRIDNLLYAKL